MTKVAGAAAGTKRKTGDEPTKKKASKKEESGSDSSSESESDEVPPTCLDSIPTPQISAACLLSAAQYWPVPLAFLLADNTEHLGLL